MQVGLKNGIVLAITMVCAILGLYFADKSILIKPGINILIPLAIIIVFLIKNGLDTKNSLAGEMDFQAGIRQAFICLLCGILAFEITNYTIFQLDFEMLELQRQQALDNLETIKKITKLAPEKIQQLKNQTAEDYRPQLSGLFFNVANKCILGFIIASVITLILRSKK